MVAEVVRNSALQTPMLLALHAPRVLSLRLVLQKLMVTQVARLTVTVMTELLAKTAADTRVVQSVQAMVAMIVRLAKTAADTRVVQSARHMATAMTAVLVVESVLHMAVQVQLPVAATLVK
jgi:hypothetical protein